MQQPWQHNLEKRGEVEQTARKLINSALFYLSDPSLPDSIGNARRCLETAKYVLDGLHLPSPPAPRVSQQPTREGAVEAWGFANNVEPPAHAEPDYPI